jgi:hypothetical protein
MRFFAWTTFLVRVDFILLGLSLYLNLI